MKNKNLYNISKDDYETLVAHCLGAFLEVHKAHKKKKVILPEGAHLAYFYGINTTRTDFHFAYTETENHTFTVFDHDPKTGALTGQQQETIQKAKNYYEWNYEFDDTNYYISDIDRLLKELPKIDPEMKLILWYDAYSKAFRAEVTHD